MKNEFDNDLTDKGWQTMSRLLDREMPEQRRRRRFAWWLLALLLLPLGGAGGWWLFQPSKPANVPPPPVEQPKVSKPVAEAKEPNFPKVGNETFRKFETFGKLDALPVSTQFPAVVGVPADDKRQDVIPNGDVQPLTPSPLTGISGDANRSETFRKFETFGKLGALPVVPQFVENEIINTPRPSVVAPFAAFITKRSPEPKRWHFGLAAGLASESFSALNGFSAGAAVDWQFARKWGLRSGLQYAQYRLSAEERPVVSLDSYDYEAATGNNVHDLSGGGGSTPNSSLSPTVYVPVERLRQLEMPLLAWWQPARPLRVFGGFSTAYKLSAQASQESFANNQLYYASTKAAQENLNDLTSKTLPRWQVSWQAGAGIRLGRHFELDIFYKNGLGSNGNSADDAQDNFNPNLSPDMMWQPRSAGASHYFLLNGIWFF